MSDATTRPIRVRFAPSPTGGFHIGGARTALFNWIFAHKHNGTFILRIEDTDRKRYRAESEQTHKDGLRWLGLQWDEGPDVGGYYGPYHQSERSDLYRQWAEWLIEHGHAYRCSCTPERLNEVREIQRQMNLQPGYDRHCRERGAGADVGPHVIRFKMPMDGETIIQDAIRGAIVFQNADLQDLVLLKSDGLPTYHLANVVDDHFMEISHIMRADEWIATAPLHAQLYQAFDWEMPAIAHLPVILDPSGRGKLSKRKHEPDGDGLDDAIDTVVDDGSNRDKQILVMVDDFKRAGYLPEAVVNFLMNVGWSFGEDREVFTLEEAITRFRLEDINPAPGRLPYEKLEWLNGVYIREKLTLDNLVGRIKPILENAGLKIDPGQLARAVPLIRERIKTLDEAVEWIGFIFRDRVILDKPNQLIQKKMDAALTIQALRASYDTLAALDDFSHEAQEAAMRKLAERLGLKAGQLFGSVRVAVTGQTVSPPLFETMEILGQETSLARIRVAADLLEGI